jgi:2-polyprenyl-3-methyl-5-hydroxy-6-metoxy-1,4-benzoquinol methylase
MEPARMTPQLLEQLMRRFRRPQATIASIESPSAPPREPEMESLTIDLPATLAREFAAEYPLADASAERVIAAMADADLSHLARRSPGLVGYDWANYLKCSLCRMVRIQRALARHVPAGARVLDFGAYFGNFALACRAMGFRVDAVDSYGEYGSALASLVALQREAGVEVHDFDRVGYDLAGLGRSIYDAVICAGVIEHIPHTPKRLLDTLTAVLKPGGVLLLDTPNLGYLYKRLALLAGETIFTPIAQQYFSDLPFEGHHREYTVAELEWMLQTAGHELVSLETFNYSVFGQTQILGEHVAYYREMETDPTLRELIFTVSRRPDRA